MNLIAMINLLALIIGLTGTAVTIKQMFLRAKRSSDERLGIIKKQQDRLPTSTQPTSPNKREGTFA